MEKWPISTSTLNIQVPKTQKFYRGQKCLKFPYNLTCVKCFEVFKRFCLAICFFFQRLFLQLLFIKYGPSIVITVNIFAIQYSSIIFFFNQRFLLQTLSIPKTSGKRKTNENSNIYLQFLTEMSTAFFESQGMSLSDCYSNSIYPPIGN